MNKIQKKQVNNPGRPGGSRGQALADIDTLKKRPVLRKKEYQALTGLSIPTITRLALSGEIPSRKIGNSVLLINNLC